MANLVTIHDNCNTLRDLFMRLPEGRKAKGRRYPQWLILDLMTLAKLCGYHAYAEMARFVRNHSYLLPLLDFHCAPDKRGGFTLGETCIARRCREEEAVP